MDFNTNFMLNSPDFIINFMANFITSTKISLKSTRFHEIHSISLKSTGFHYGFHCGFHSSEICNEIHNEISKFNILNCKFLYACLANMSKICNEVLWNVVDFMKSCDILWISWNLVAFNNIMLDLMDWIKSFKICGFNEILLLLIKLCWISWNHVKSCEFIKYSRFKFKSTSGGLQIIQILFRFTTDFICRFQCGLHYGFTICTFPCGLDYGFHLWI